MPNFSLLFKYDLGFGWAYNLLRLQSGLPSIDFLKKKSEK